MKTQVYTIIALAIGSILYSGYQVPVPMEISDDLENTLIEEALGHLLSERLFPSELERMRKTKEIYLHDIQITSHPWPFYNDPAELKVDTTKLSRTPEIPGFKTHLVTKTNYCQKVPAPEGRFTYLLQIGNIDLSGDNATVVIDVLCTCGNFERPTMCMSGGSVQYSFRQVDYAWEYERTLRHLEH